MRYLPIVLILMLLSAPNAFAQEWYEAAESSSAGYQLEAEPGNHVSVKLDRAIVNIVDRLPSRSSFTHKTGNEQRVGVAGSRAMPVMILPQSGMAPPE